mmetsp:Transcript_34832/g.70455  ORF Transcript_34832/g.70455 Transcript_34832/m.70455 type:complete len:250 (-) Transcript_34832:746-1495(-)
MLTYLINRRHEPNISRDGCVKVGLKQNVHVRVYAPIDQKGAVSKQVRFERSRDYRVVSLPHFRRKVQRQVFRGGLVAVKAVLPPRSFPRFYEARHIRILLLGNILKPGLVDNPRNEAGRILAIRRRRDCELFGHKLFLDGGIAEALAVAGTNMQAGFTSPPGLILQAETAGLVRRETIVIFKENIEEVRRQGRLLAILRLRLLHNFFSNCGNERCVSLGILPHLTLTTTLLSVLLPPVWFRMRGRSHRH